MSDTYTITVEPVGREIECREDQTILDACLRAGVWVPHSCTHGTCATCKVDVLDGDVDHGAASSFALMDFERDEGKTLTCCAQPRSDVTFEADIDVDEELEVFPVEDYHGTITEIEDLTSDIKRVRIELDRELGFNAGQYMRVMVPGTDGVDRTWSMANDPTESEVIEFQVRNVPGGVATDGWLFKNAQVGDEVDLSGPYGRFVLRTWEEDTPIIMLAGGTGLAPLASMIKHALVNEEYEGHITLYHGGRTRADIYDLEFFRELEEEYPDQFTYHPCVSAEVAAGANAAPASSTTSVAGAEDAAGAVAGAAAGEAEEASLDNDAADALAAELAEQGFRVGYVNAVMEEDFEKLTGYQGYMCGSPAMVDACRKSFMGRRLFPRDIFNEDFTNEADKAQGTGLNSPLIKR